MKQSWEREAAASNAISKSRYPPYHPAYSALEAQDDEGENRYGDQQPAYRYYSPSEDEGEGEDDDDIPLSHSRQRHVKLRRGSEGLEVRPRGLGVGYVDEDPLDSSDDEGMLVERQENNRESDWEELYDKRQGPSLYDSGSDDD